ncbi:Ulp1 protease family protein [Stagonosporopsis vannaccii]|nr:Ulp1 protease family protein [Stagonosporopsis vannaccii]
MATSKRDFDCAFDIPVGSPGDNVAAEPQARYTSPTRSMPGHWPEDVSIAEHATAPSSSSVFNTLSRFATSLTLEVWKIPERLIQRFTRPLQIRAVPVVTEEGAPKRRLVDAGVAPAPSTRKLSPGDRQDLGVTHTPRVWIETPPTPSNLLTTVSKAPGFNQGLGDYDTDDSLDWSMDDVESSTPPHNPKTGSPTGAAWLRRPERKILTPRTRILSPNAHFAMLSRSKATPMQKQLLKNQLRLVNKVSNTSPVLLQQDHTTPSPLIPNTTISELKKKVLDSSLLSCNAAAVTASAQETSARYRAELESRQNQDADAQATAEQSYPHFVEANDRDLSYLPDANDISSSFNCLRTSSPSSTQNKSIRWAAQGRVKSYYVDECISDMLDSTLESIRSPIPKPTFKEDEDYDERTKVTQAVTFKEPEPTSDSDDSVDGPSLDDPSLDDPSLDSSSFERSLEESQLSKELLSDLEEDFKQLLSKQPPPPPPPKPLIAPLTEDERAKLDDLAAKSNHGKNGSYPIIPDKISARDFGTLLPDRFNGSAKAWLNDEIVNQYLATIVKTLNDDCGFIYKRGGPAPPYHAFSSHWYNSVLRGMKSVERWAGRVGLGGKQFLDAKIVFFPICDGSHWRLLAVNPRKRTIEYLDSLGWDGSKYVAKLLEYLQHELKESWEEEKWTIVELQRSSRQLNGSDCGVFVLLNALVVARGEEMKKVVACNGMLEARERLAVTIITGHPVELDY